MEPEESSTDLARHPGEDTEATRDGKSRIPQVEPRQTSPGEPRSKINSLTAYVAARLPALRTAATLSLIAATAAAIMQPPAFVDEFLSRTNCKSQSTKLNFDDQHFEFIAVNTTSTFACSCSETQQLWELERIMVAHVNESDATCGVWCVRRTEDGQWFGYISQLRGGLPDMYYCRMGMGLLGRIVRPRGRTMGMVLGGKGGSMILMSRGVFFRRIRRLRTRSTLGTPADDMDCPLMFLVRVPSLQMWDWAFVPDRTEWASGNPHPYSRVTKHVRLRILYTSVDAGPPRKLNADDSERLIHLGRTLCRYKTIFDHQS